MGSVKETAKAQREEERQIVRSLEDPALTLRFCCWLWDLKIDETLWNLKKKVIQMNLHLKEK